MITYKELFMGLLLILQLGNNYALATKNSELLAELTQVTKSHENLLKGQQATIERLVEQISSLKDISLSKHLDQANNLLSSIPVYPPEKIILTTVLVAVGLYFSYTCLVPAFYKILNFKLYSTSVGGQTTYSPPDLTKFSSHSTNIPQNVYNPLSSGNAPVPVSVPVVSQNVYDPLSPGNALVPVVSQNINSPDVVSVPATLTQQSSSLVVSNADDLLSITQNPSSSIAIVPNSQASSLALAPVSVPDASVAIFNIVDGANF